MAATTSWSNQLTRLFNAPLDKESVFDDLYEMVFRIMIRSHIALSS